MILSHRYSLLASFITTSASVMAYLPITLPLYLITAAAAALNVVVVRIAVSTQKQLVKFTV